MFTTTYKRAASQARPSNPSNHRRFRACDPRPPGPGECAAHAEVMADVGRQRQATAMHRLGPRPVLEALIEVAAGKPLDAVLTDYAQLHPETVATFGGDRSPASPLHLVGSGP